VFGAVLLQYYWASAGTKLDGFLSPSDGGYIQIFPKAVEAAGYDTSQLGVFHWVVVMAGTYAEYILPLLIIIGLLTRLAAIGMIGFVLYNPSSTLPDMVWAGQIWAHGLTKLQAR
jgi:putative oxidoreductase